MRAIAIALIFVYIFSGCDFKNGTSKKTDVFEINYLKSYPNKELELREVAEVKYIKLKTKNDKPFYGRIAYCDNEVIIGFTKNIKDVVVFSGQGIEQFRFNHMGEGPKEYQQGSYLSYDDQNKELYIYSVYSRRINVYSMAGEFKRSFYTYNKISYTSIIPYNNDLVAYNRNMDDYNIAYLKTSADDGKLIEIIDTHFKKKREIDIVWDLDSKGGNASYSWYDNYAMVFSGKNLLINDFSSDTIYYYNPSGKVLPHTAIVPSIEKITDPWIVFVNGESRKYCFYMAFINKMPPKGEKGIVRSLFFDKSNGGIFDVNIFDRNYPDYEHTLRHPRGNGLFIEQLEAYDLIEQNQKGKLKGELKDIASTLDINDSPVLMIIQLEDRI